MQDILKIIIFKNIIWRNAGDIEINRFYSVRINPMVPSLFSGDTYEYHYFYRPSGWTVGAVGLSKNFLFKELQDD